MNKLLAIAIWIVTAGLLVYFIVQGLAGVSPSNPAGIESLPAQRLSQSNPKPMATIPDNQGVMEEKIRRASVSIVMLSPTLHVESAGGNYIGQGIGSLIVYRGVKLLVTHNHYDEILQDLTIIQFRDADNRLLLTILGNLWKSLVVYQDAGTQVLRAPEGLADKLAPTIQPASVSLMTGEVVFVAHRENPKREKITSLPAIVEETKDKQGVPIYQLRSLDGQVIQPGDSGGGIWYDGELVGNNWVVLMKSAGDGQAPAGAGEDGLVYTDRSYAARIPVEICPVCPALPRK
jgi:hypothetical protein